MGKTFIDWEAAKKNKKQIFIDSRGNQFNSIEELKSGKRDFASKEEKIKALQDEIKKLEEE